MKTIGINPSSTAVCVLAMHRSGSSAVAGLLHHLGVRMGNRLLQPDQRNPTGYWEDLDWVELNMQILHLAEASWYDPPLLKALEPFAGRVGALVGPLIAARTKYPLWGFKDPRACITIPFIHSFLPNPHYIYVHRERAGVIASLMRREAKGPLGDKSPDYWSQLYTTYTNRALDFLADHRSDRNYVVDFDHLVSESGRTESILALARFLSISDSARIETACQFIRIR